MLSRSLCRKGENELWLIGAEGPFHSIPKLHLERHISRMIAQLFKELLECFSHDRPLPGDRALLLRGGSNTFKKPPTGVCD